MLSYGEREDNESSIIHLFDAMPQKSVLMECVPKAQYTSTYLRCLILITKKTYDVFIPFESYKGGINGKENFSVLTEVLIGHELDHPYEFDNAGHNG